MPCEVGLAKVVDMSAQLRIPLRMVSRSGLVRSNEIEVRSLQTVCCDKAVFRQALGLGNLECVFSFSPATWIGTLQLGGTAGSAALPRNLTLLLPPPATKIHSSKGRALSHKMTVEKNLGLPLTNSRGFL